MKTIEESAIECANIYLQGYRDSCTVDENDFVDVFEAGVKFAQRWIQYSEQEPPQGETVLVKLNNGYVFTAKYVKSAKEERFNAWHDGYSFYKCVNTHWRPIEYK